jgi:hypothetical protein
MGWPFAVPEQVFVDVAEVSHPAAAPYPWHSSNVGVRSTVQNDPMLSKGQHPASVILVSHPAAPNQEIKNNGPKIDGLIISELPFMSTFIESFG